MTCKECGTALYDDIWCPVCGYDFLRDDEPAHHAPSEFVAEQRERREAMKRRDATLKAQSNMEERAERRAARSAYIRACEEVIR